MTLAASHLATPRAGAVVDADVVIVGSGAGGAAVAGELRRLGRDVVVLEAGPAADGIPGDHVLNTVVDGEVTTDDLTPHAEDDPIEGLPGLRAFHGVGGLFTRWAGMVPRPHLEAEWDNTLPADELSALLDDAEALVHATSTDILSLDPPISSAARVAVIQRAEGAVELPASLPESSTGFFRIGRT